MTRLGTSLQMTASVVFVIAGAAYALWGVEPAMPQGGLAAGPSLSGLPSAGPGMPGAALPQVPAASMALSIPQIYLNPQNPVMWALLAVIWAMVLLDGVGQVIDPSDGVHVRADRPRVWPLVTMALIAASLWPRMLDRPLLLAVVTGFSAVCTTLGAHHAAGRHRPAVGFFAGWATALTSAALAGLAAEPLELTAPAISALAILPAAAVGMIMQIRIGPSIGYSTALIWAFCGLAVTTMGSDPMIALAAILGITAMASVLVRAAS